MAPHEMDDVLVLLDELEDLLSRAKPVPLSDQVRVERDAVFRLLDRLRAALPDAVKDARQTVKQREELVSETQRDCDQLLSDAREQASRELSPSVTFRLAERRADEILADARRVAHENQLDVDVWADQILSSLDSNFDRLVGAIRRGRHRIANDSTRDSISDLTND